MRDKPPLFAMNYVTLLEKLSMITSQSLTGLIQRRSYTAYQADRPTDQSSRPVGDCTFYTDRGQTLQKVQNGYFGLKLSSIATRKYPTPHP